MSTESKVYEVLKQLEIPYDRYEHPPVFTIEESMSYWKEGAGVHCKNLFFRNNPKGDKHYLVVIHHSKNLDVRIFSRRIEKKVMSFASEHRMMRYLGVTPGAVSPFGLINDHEKHVQVILDADLQKYEKISFHPNVNTASISLLFSDFIRFMEWKGNRFIFLELDVV
jgi:Ala-tRNA(Pro) deacylase